MDNERGLELVTSPFSGLFRSSFFLVFQHLANFDALIQRVFCVIQKITTDNLCKPFHNAIMIAFSVQIS